MASALTGLRVLDLSAALSGPFCSMLLADLGAEVIKIEPPGGEIFRNMGPYYRGEWSSYFVGIHRNKRGIVLDLKCPAALEAFYDLVRVSDIVLDNFRPGVASRLRVDYQSLNAVNPRVVACSISGFGSGVCRDRTAFDVAIQAASGVMSITGDEEGNVVKVGVPIGDLAAGQFAAIGILAALAERSRSGKGQHVDISMFDSQISLLSYLTSWYTSTGEVPRPLGTGHLGLEPYGAFRTRDGQLVLAIGTEKFWVELCAALGVPEMSEDPRFDVVAHRQENRKLLRKMLEEILSARTTAEWMDVMVRAGIPAGPVNSVAQALHEPCVAERHMLVEVDQPGYGKAHLSGNPVKLSRTPGETFEHAPALGENTAEVLGELLGYSTERIAALMREGAAARPEGDEVHGWPAKQSLVAEGSNLRSA